MTTAENFLSDEQKNIIEQAIAEAEQSTCAELMGAVATESGRYDRTESIFGIFIALIFLGIAEYLKTTVFTAGSWETGGGIPFSWQAVLVVVGFVVGSGLSTYLFPIRRILVPEQEMEEEVRRAASHVFALAKVSSTRSRGGVLVYVSLFERKVVILADSGSLKILGQEGIDKLRDVAVEHLKKGEKVETFSETIKQAAEMLKDKLPPGEENPDELSNKLLIFHPRP